MIYGNCLLALAQFILFSSIGLVSNKWFADNERAFSEGYLVSSAVVGNLMSHVCSIIFLDSGDFNQGFKYVMTISTVGLVASALFAVTFISS